MLHKQDWFYRLPIASMSSLLLTSTAQQPKHHAPGKAANMSYLVAIDACLSLVVMSSWATATSLFMSLRHDHPSLQRIYSYAIRDCCGISSCTYLLSYNVSWDTNNRSSIVFIVKVQTYKRGTMTDVAVYTLYNYLQLCNVHAAWSVKKVWRFAVVDSKSAKSLVWLTSDDVVQW